MIPRVDGQTGSPFRARPTERNPLCAADGRSADQEIPRILCNSNPQPDESNSQPLSHPIL